MNAFGWLPLLLPVNISPVTMRVQECVHDDDTFKYQAYIFTYLPLFPVAFLCNVGALVAYWRRRHRSKNTHTVPFTVQNLRVYLITAVKHAQVSQWWSPVWSLDAGCHQLILQFLSLHISSCRKSPSCIVMMNLALSDSSFSLTLPLRLAYYFRGGIWDFPDWLCRVCVYGFYVNLYTRWHKHPLNASRIPCAEMKCHMCHVSASSSSPCWVSSVGLPSPTPSVTTLWWHPPVFSCCVWERGCWWACQLVPSWSAGCPWGQIDC